MTTPLTQPARYVRMPKTGSTSIANWLIDRGYGKSMGHMRALEVSEAHPGVPRWGTVRHPLLWYRSWYRHCMRNYPRNERALVSLRAYGGGSEAFRDVVFGLTHPAARAPHFRDLDYRDHLFNPAGDRLGDDGPGLWTRAIAWFFGDGKARDPLSVGWAVTDLVDLASAERYLHAVYGFEDHPLEHRNAADVCALPVDYDADMVRWVLEADGPMVGRIRHEFGAKLRVE